VTDIAWSAQTRLCARFRRLAARRVPHNKIVVAIARELTGFVCESADPNLPLFSRFERASSSSFVFF